MTVLHVAVHAVIKTADIILWEVFMKLKKITALILSSVIAVSCFGCSSAKKAVKQDNSKLFDEICDEIFTDSLSSSVLGTHYKIIDPSKYGIEFDEDAYVFGETSADSFKEAEKINAAYLDRIKDINRNSLSEEQKITYDVLKWELETETAYAGRCYLQNLLGPTGGIVANLATNYIEYTFYGEDDIDDYFKIIEATPDGISSLCDFVYDVSDKGYMLPDWILDKDIEQCDNYLNAEKNPIEESFVSRIDKLNLDENKKNEYIEKNKKMVAENITPCYSMLKETIRNVKGTGKTEGGLVNYGDEGKRYYEALLRENTSSDMSVMETAKYIDKKLAAYIGDLQMVYFLDSKAVEALDTYEPDFKTPEEVLEFIISHMEDEFVKPVTTAYNIEYMNPACEIDGVLAYYLIAPIDNVSYNNIKVNKSMVGSDAMSMYTTIAHEGMPGHMYQFTSMYSNNEIPDIRKICNFIGASEGWAEYAATRTFKYLTEKDNLPESSNTVFLINERFSYLLYSRVDIGVNYEGWTIEDVQKYLADYIGDNYETAQEIFYGVIGDPCGLMPYTIGTELMFDMEMEFDDHYGNKEGHKMFNRFIFENGIMPFPVYESLMDKFFEENK